MNADVFTDEGRERRTVDRLMVNQVQASWLDLIVAAQWLSEPRVKIANRSA
jgi:hypothetical protein